MLEEQDLIKARQRVGWFVILGIGLVIAVLLSMSIRTDLFAKKFSLYVAPSSAASFHIGQAVKLHGFRVGSVQHIVLQKNGAVKVQLRIMEKYRAMLNPGVMARSSKEGFIGELSLELIPGRATGQLIASNKVIPYESEATIEQFLQDIKPAVHNADTLLKEMADLSLWLNDPYGDVRISMQHMRVFSEKMKRLEIEKLSAELQLVAHQVQQLTQQLVKQKSVQRFNRVLIEAEDNLKNLKPLTQGLEKDAPSILQTSVKIVGDIDHLLQTLQSIGEDVSAASPELPGLMHRSAETIQDMQEMAESLKASWLFSEQNKHHQNKSHTDPILDFRP